MPFQEISSPSLRKLFVQQLEGLILSGELRPGDRLPTERELADEMKISKTVVHEGIRELRRQGNNLNQLVVMARQGHIELVNMEPFMEVYENTWQTLNSLLSRVG